MCGRYALNSDVNDMIVEFVAEGGRAQDWLPGWQPSYSIAPTDHAPIVRTRDDHRELELAQWGFWPAWAKDDARRPRPINARLEGVATNGMFRHAFASARCVVPMIGYYEWVPVSDGKEPHYLHGGGLLSAAGLYTARKLDGDDDHSWAVTYTIITREARDAGGRVHDRMPVFLTDDALERWLTPGKPEHPEELLGMLDASSTTVASSIEEHEVSRAVNNSRTAPAGDVALILPL